MKIVIKNKFVELSKWSIKSSCSGNFGGHGGSGRYFSWNGWKISIGIIKE